MSNSKKYVIYSIKNNLVEYISKNFKNNGGTNNIVRYLQQAKVFDNSTKATNFLTNLPKTIKVNRAWVLSEVVIKNGKLELVKKTSKLKNTSNISNEIIDNCIINNANVKMINHYQSIESIDSNKYTDILSKLKEYIIYLKNRLIELNNQLDIISKEQVDYEHYIEFNVLSASEGYCAYKSFHDLRVKRRSIKDEISKINTILNIFKDDTDFDKIEIQLHKIDEQVYSPRVKFELFK